MFNFIILLFIYICMCGITGIINGQKDVIQHMTRAINHRGPDACNYAQYDNVSLGHVRLSILDLSIGANQPMYDDEDNYVIVFNGEIYNYKELQKELLDAGYVFHTNSDTEVVLKGWMHWGSMVLDKFIGFFAFAIYDKQNKKIILARDKLGKKPLFYYTEGQYFCFASELKALKVVTGSWSLQEQYLYDIMSNSFTQQESAYQNIQSVPPAHYMVVDEVTGNYELHAYFSFLQLIDATYHEQLTGWSQQQLLSEFRRLLEQSIARRYVSDVQVGVICSGGLDSSLVSHFAQAYDKKTPLFHINVLEHSECTYAKLLAEHLQLPLHVNDLDYDIFVGQYEKTVYHMEYPLIHSNSIGISQVCNLAHQYEIKVVLGGEGADELFGGYPHHRNYYRMLKLHRLLPLSHSLRKKIKGLMMVGDMPVKSDFPYPTKQYACSKNLFEQSYEAYAHIPKDFDRTMSAFLFTDIQEYLLPLLIRADRVSMAHGVEMRLPLLDIDLIKFVLNLPLQQRMNRNRNSNKILMRQLAKEILPQQIIDKPKVGFTMPYLEKYFQEHQEKFIAGLKYLGIPKAMVEYLLAHKEYNRIHRLYSVALFDSLLQHE